MSIGLVFSLDYEIHGNGGGSPMQLMVEPTWRMMRQFDRFGAKLTIFAEVAEILRFRDHLKASGRDTFHYNDIVEQLRHALGSGHDVQLHLHPSYVNAVLTGQRWEQDWSEYDMAQLPASRIRSLLATATAFLEEVLRPVRPDYRVYAFRAGNWAMMPTRDIASCLIENGIEVESSVFKGGQRNGAARFDYRDAQSEVLPWRADRDNICREDRSSPLWEFPIYCEMRPILSFINVNRLYRAALSRVHRLSDARSGQAQHSGPRLGQLARIVLRRHPWKADFNQCSGAQLIGALKRVQRTYDAPDRLVPFVAIGHSKLYNRRNEADLEKFLDFASARPQHYRYSTYRDLLSDASSRDVDSDGPASRGMQRDFGPSPHEALLARRL